MQGRSPVKQHLSGRLEVCFWITGFAQEQEAQAQQEHHLGSCCAGKQLRPEAIAPSTVSERNRQLAAGLQLEAGS